MTDREKAIVMAYTGVVMLKDDKLDIFYQYIAEKMGRATYTHELGSDEVAEAIKKAAEQDFLDLCRIEEPEIKAVPADSLLVVQHPYILNRNSRKETYDRLLEEKKNGLILLCHGEKAIVMSKPDGIDLEAPECLEDKD